MKFYYCKDCGEVITVNYSKHSDEPRCCGESMVELKANTTDAATEKHVPVIKVEGNKVIVEVGSVAHPMAEEHFITFIAIETAKTEQIHYLKPGEVPVAVFALADDDKLVAAYEYCNLHGLWKAEI